MVESAHGMDTTDELLEIPTLESGGVYTSVGTYDATELVSMFACLAEITGSPVDELLTGFGKHLFVRFHSMFPQMFEGKSNVAEFLESIHDHIHVEVRKLYPEADLPHFTCKKHHPGLLLEYISNRPLAMFALGLIHGCIAHFGGTETVSFKLLGPKDYTRAEFLVK